MKPIYQSYAKPISKFCCIVMPAMVLTAFFASCTPDEIEPQPETELLNESFLPRNDAGSKSPVLSDTNPLTVSDSIIPPINPPTVPKPPKKP